MKTRQIRITYTDYKRLRKLFKAIRGETAASYMSRLIKYLQELEK